MEKTVCELFAGVGGFRCGLNSISSIEDTKKDEKYFVCILSFIWLMYLLRLVLLCVTIQRGRFPIIVVLCLKYASSSFEGEDFVYRN